MAYHALEGVTVDLAERDGLVRDLGDKHVMILRNHGLLSWGRTVAEAYLRLWTLQRACDVQVAAGQAGGEVNRLSPQVIERMLGESGPGESKTCEDVFAALVRLIERLEIPPRRTCMGSSSKRKTTMAKLNRERALAERRLEKRAKKDARKRAAAEQANPAGDM